MNNLKNKYYSHLMNFAIICSKKYDAVRAHVNKRGNSSFEKYNNENEFSINKWCLAQLSAKR